MATFLDFFMPLSIIFSLAGILISSYSVIKSFRARSAAAHHAATSYLTVAGPQAPFATMNVATGQIISVDGLPDGGRALVNLQTGEVEYSLPTPTNTQMETHFSLDELEAAQEFVNSGRKLH